MKEIKDYKPKKILKPKWVADDYIWLPKEQDPARLLLLGIKRIWGLQHRPGEIPEEKTIASKPNKAAVRERNLISMLEKNPELIQMLEGIINGGKNGKSN